MSENVGKHLIEISYGAYYYRGTVVSETDKYFMLSPGGGARVRRAMKGATLVLIGAERDPREAIKAYERVYRSFTDEIKSAEAALSEVRQRRRAATIAALNGDAP